MTICSYLGHCSTYKMFRFFDALLHDAPKLLSTRLSSRAACCLKQIIGIGYSDSPCMHDVRTSSLIKISLISV